MSHFTVLVVGEDIDGQLAPFDENLDGVQDAKWDWYQVGGRWSGFFTLKDGATGTKGTRSLLDGGPERSGVDSARKGDIDFTAMMDATAERAAEAYDKAKAATGDRVWDSWETVRARHEKIEDARNEYNSHPSITALRKAGFWEVDQYLCSREEYIERARNSAISTFAVLKDGEWYEKGSMGCWGVVANEKDQNLWNEEFSKLLDSLPDDTLLTVVDCHI